MKSNTNDPTKGPWLIFIFIAVLLVAAAIFSGIGTQKITYTQKEFEVDLMESKVDSVIISQNRETPTGVATITFKSGLEQKLNIPNVVEFQNKLENGDVKVYIANVPKDNWFLVYVLPALCLIIGAVLFFSLMSRGGNGGAAGKMMSFGKSKAKLSEGDIKITFKDVAGLKEEKQELEEIVEFLREPGKFIKVGARIPKGVLLEGAPGTGKTLLAKAIAGEAHVPFFSISGSDFVEMFVGVGASRVRDLFEEAKKNHPCIVFIDEIDAVARKRGSGMGGGHDEREQTLNQLLVEMDGFAENEGIIVIAATNRVDILDPAILRPGRFDRIITIGSPDVGGREEILKVHSKNKPLSDDVNLQQIAQTTRGFTGADLENLLNEGAIIAAKNDRAFILSEDLKKAFIKVGVGSEKHSRIVSEKERKITAYHEAGHAVLFHVFPDVGPVYTVSIIPTGGAGGYTMPLPEGDDIFLSKSKMMQDIMVGLGGRIAEDIIFGDITTGAAGDIKQASKIARKMVTRFGMSDEIGMINYDDDGDDVVIGRDFMHARNFSEEMAAKIDHEVKKIIDDCYISAKEKILEHEKELHACAQMLLEKERITKDEFESIFSKN